MSTKWYRTGKVSVVLGSPVVGGVATYWKAAALPPLAGDGFTDNDKLYEVIDIESDGSMMLDRPYEGLTDSSMDYAIIRSSSGTTNTRIATMASEVLNRLGDKLTVSTTAPSAGQGQDGDVWIVAVTEVL